MELLVLIILYYLSQNPDFERSVKPLLGELKNSEQALKFLEELSQFSHLFSGFNPKKENGTATNSAQSQNTNGTQNGHTNTTASQSSHSESGKTAQSASPTAGIADGFIEELLSKYFYSTK